jgi:serine/threonine protein kinase
MLIRQNMLFADRYLLKLKLGVGGYSEVWMAEDTKSDNMQVAIKIFAPGNGLDTKGLKAFSSEYSLVFQLNHPNLLTPMHFDDWEDMPYLILQYMENGSCFDKIGKTREPELAQFMLQMSDAINYMHTRPSPIIHQDIKPDNVLIDKNGNYLLTDFGISTSMRRTLTKSMGEASSGTTAYMSPEKFSDNLKERAPSAANDIFSLGVTMFELLTGELPYGDQGGMAAVIGISSAQLP